VTAIVYIPQLFRYRPASTTRDFSTSQLRSQIITRDMDGSEAGILGRPDRLPPQPNVS
jgi:hypothetical protein